MLCCFLLFILVIERMSREIAKDLADKLVEIRKDNLKWYDTKTKLHERNPDGYTKPKQVCLEFVAIY
jgi:hypothetical protein